MRCSRTSNPGALDTYRLGLRLQNTNNIPGTSSDVPDVQELSKLFDTVISCLLIFQITSELASERCLQLEIPTSAYIHAREYTLEEELKNIRGGLKHFQHFLIVS